MEKSKDLKEQVLEDLICYLEDRLMDKVKPGKKADEEVEELPEEEGEALLIVGEPVEEEEEVAEEDEDELVKRLKGLISKRKE